MDWVRVTILGQSALDQIPRSGRCVTDGQEPATLAFAKRPEAFANGDIAYEIEVSTDPAAGVWTTVTPDVNDGTRISQTLPGDHARLFARLKVTQIR
jgi:hypothetical protein